MAGRKDMKIMRKTMGKKAFLFTLGMLLVTLAILSFAKFVSEESGNEKGFFQMAAITNRLDDADSSLQRSIADVFILHSGIEVSTGNHSIVFEEPLPNDAGGFASGLARLKRFAEANDTTVHIDTNETVSEIPLFILPQNTVYRHNFSNREILVALPGDPNSSIIRYKTTLTIPENVSCSWDYDPGHFSYQLDVISPKESGCDSTKQVSLADNAMITIASQKSPSNRIYLSLNRDSISIKMDDAGTFNISTKSEITFYSAPGGVWLGNGTVEIRFDEFNLKKKGGVRII
ncbi:MAG: hypothetical protein NT001_02960 [Candidatus Woesearchaeota archaeon]|nr:hypothetical protein [Candidatus Woesearchaeota archaeon]